MLLLPTTNSVFENLACPDELFSKLCKAHVHQYIKTLKEINVAFMPYERQIFSLDTPESFNIYFNPHRASHRSAMIERMSEQIATLCSTLGEYPSVRYRRWVEPFGIISFKNAHLIVVFFQVQK